MCPTGTRPWSNLDWLLATVLGWGLLAVAASYFAAGDNTQGWIGIGLFIIGVPLVARERKRRSR